VQELGGSIARQIAKLADRNIPHHRCHAQFMNGSLLGGRRLLALLTSVSSNPLLPRGSNFWGKFRILGFCDCCLRIGCELVIRW